MRELVALEMSSEQVTQLVHCCARDPAFPKTPRDWHELVASAERALPSDAFPSRVALEPERFLTWCAHVGVMPGLDALRAHVILLRSPAAAHDYGRGAGS